MTLKNCFEISQFLARMCLPILGLILASPLQVFSQMEVLEFHCPSSGYRERFVQGFDQRDQERNVQHIIVVCERAGQIRSIKIPLDPKMQVIGEPLLAQQSGMGRSELLGQKLPRFLVPGNTCPLFPITAYLERNICPVDGSPGLNVVLVGP